MRRALLAFAVASSFGTMPSHLLDPLWALLGPLRLTSPVTKIGCGMDPNGQGNPAPAPLQPQKDIGCGMDPDGHCVPGS